jgi:hypothetical protein
MPPSSRRHALVGLASVAITGCDAAARVDEVIHARATTQPPLPRAPVVGSDALDTLADLAPDERRAFTDERGFAPLPPARPREWRTFRRERAQSVDDVIEDPRAFAWSGGVEHRIDGGIVGQHHVHARGSVDRHRGVVEDLRAVVFQRLRIRGRSIPHAHGFAAAARRAHEARSEEAGAEECDHASTVGSRVRGVCAGRPSMRCAAIRGALGRFARSRRVARPVASSGGSR